MANIYFFIAFLFFLNIFHDSTVYGQNESILNGSTVCGSMGLALYGVNKLKPKIFGKRLHIDETLDAKHLGIILCGLEFHFGYIDNAITICERTEDESPSEYRLLTCINEMHPEFEFDKEYNKIRIVPRQYLENGRIKYNITQFKRKHYGTFVLKDFYGQEMHSNFTLKEVIDEILNEQFRKGQFEYPMLEEFRNENNENGYNIHSLAESKLIGTFKLPKNIKNEYEWNRQVDKIEGNRGKNLPIESNILDLYSRLKLLSTQDPQNKTNIGPFTGENFNPAFNNCLDFAKNFVLKLAPDQSCDWPSAMDQLGVLGPFRAMFAVYKGGIDALLEMGHQKLKGRTMSSSLSEEEEKKENEEMG